MSDFKVKLERYAELIVKIGANVQPGQTVVVNAAVDAAELVRSVVRKAYEAGAYQVKVVWSDETVTRLRYDMAHEDAFLEEPTWSAGEKLELARAGAASITIMSEDPDLLKGVPGSRIANNQKTASKALKEYRELSRAFKFSWSLSTAPSQGWADKVFPDAPPEARIGLLWDAIFKLVRADREDPIAAWEEHLANLKRRADTLNAKQYRQLRYAGPGTDLTIALPKDHVWLGGRKQNAQGVWFVPNLPTEEVYTAPHRDGVSGTVSSTKPLSYAGKIIDGFSFTFEGGQVAKVTAAQNEETLTTLVDMDEGARYLGEVALVPHRSPISDSNLLYYKTIFDENASCHLAIGGAYASCVQGGGDLSQEELSARGLNTSIVHTDFMVGSGELDIFGLTEDGREEPVFVKGNWAF
ncbi:aminopeptidase [Cohnella nanjingensis]|uniref:Aminopeptidase n=1 Tax=Cohnella nanjingensis TaxID=1387779 RepID=A0A7X0VF88_9BACL|nr:aminopeptidase [Cohnella nanjingensis]MBB6671033.1 aminopeptidase [Cohnella nanjingensis]